MMLNTLFVSLFTNFVVAPTYVKLVYSLVLWLCVVLFPTRLILKNTFGSFPNVLLLLCFFLTICAVLHSCFTDDGVRIGNKWITLFGNPECMFMLLVPGFIYLGDSEDGLIHLKDAVVVFMFLGFLGLLTGNIIPPDLIWISAVFFPFFHSMGKFLTVISLLLCIYSSFFAEETFRTMIFIIFILLVGYVVVYRFKSLIMVKLTCIVFLFIPFLLALTMLISTQQQSIIGDYLGFVMNATGNEILSADTRTFLFSELSVDLTDNHSWLFGKGAYSHYFSPFFAQSTSGEGDHYERLYSEVTLLQLLLRAGITYVVCYYSLIVYAIFRVLKIAKNRLLLNAAVIASGWVFVSCFSYLNGCSFLHLGFFMLIGCCMSKKWLYKTDKEVRDTLNRYRYSFKIC